MKIKSHIKNGLLAFILAFAMPSLATNLNFMKDTPFGNFTEEDHAIFEKALYDILDNGADGEIRTWSNENTKAGGKIKVLESFKRDDFNCRSLAIANQASGRSNTGKYNFCKLENGKWKITN